MRWGAASGHGAHPCGFSVLHRLGARLEQLAVHAVGASQKGAEARAEQLGRTRDARVALEARLVFEERLDGVQRQLLREDMAAGVGRTDLDELAPRRRRLAVLVRTGHREQVRVVARELEDEARLASFLVTCSL